ncbi:MAG: hypothetical protein GY911_00585, partial [Actinomycetales bacterium]|nr:hypothetical protein [Actinomycetales bacterium]
MKRHLLIAARLFLVAIGVTVIASLVDWRTVAVIPAGSPGPDERIAEVSTTFPVIDTIPLDGGVVRVVFDAGTTEPIPEDWPRPGLHWLLGDADTSWLLGGRAIAGLIYPLQ